jgi:hypothetical protein
VFFGADRANKQRDSEQRRDDDDKELHGEYVQVAREEGALILIRK